MHATSALTALRGTRLCSSTCTGVWKPLSKERDTRRGRQSDKRWRIGRSMSRLQAGTRLRADWSRDARRPGTGPPTEDIVEKGFSYMYYTQRTQSLHTHLKRNQRRKEKGKPKLHPQETNVRATSFFIGREYLPRRTVGACCMRPVSPSSSVERRIGSQKKKVKHLSLKPNCRQ
jgi:hypothetical protein